MLEDGRKLALKDLDCKTKNINPGYGPGVDYAGGRVTIQAEEFDKAIPAEPQDRSLPEWITVDLEGLREAGMLPLRFQSVIGGDYPVGDESRKRRTIAVEQEGCEARFITILEPHEETPMITEVRQTGAWELEVALRDGRLQKLCLCGMDKEKIPEESGELSVIIEEYGRDGWKKEETKPSWGKVLGNDSKDKL